MSNVESIKKIRKAMPRPKQVMAAKKSQAKSDKVGRKVKHKGGSE